MNLKDSLLLELDVFRVNLRDRLLERLGERAPIALQVAEHQRRTKLTPVEALHAGYQLGLLEALSALDDGAELIAELALERFAKMQN